MLIYLSGPITKPDPNANTHHALAIATAMVNAGLTPFVPHLSTLWQTVSPHEWQWWIDYDLRVIESCGLVVRIPGESKGADVECHKAWALGKSVLELASLDPVEAVKWINLVLQRMRKGNQIFVSFQGITVEVVR